MNDYIADVFGPEGLFASKFAGYEMRAGQVALARGIDAAMRDREHLLGEGPCGTGKGLAYLVPALWHSKEHGNRTVVATANIALQEQLIEKDLPSLQGVLPWEFSAALLKGRSNYVCISRLLQLGPKQRVEIDPPLLPQVDDITAWAARSATGDVSELAFVPHGEVWSRLSVTADDCAGAACEHKGTCFANRARAKADTADIIVTNYHLLFAHLAVRRASGSDNVLPSFTNLVLDEAHEAADVARDFFGFTVTEVGFLRLAKAAEAHGEDALAKWMRRAAGAFFGQLQRLKPTSQTSHRLRLPALFDDADLQASLADFRKWLDTKRLWPESPKQAREFESLALRAERVADRIQQVRELEDSDFVYWVEEARGGRVRLCGKPIDVSRLLRRELFDATASVSLVSATLTTGGNFDFARRELGVPEDASEVVADSPFDFESQALLVVPRDLPDPRSADFTESVAGAVEEVIERCAGRTLGLFTSHRNLNAVYEHIRPWCQYSLLRQGDAPRTQLAQEFKDDVRSVLLGTGSFWTGIDVPGEALTGVVIDKIPFPSPGDPVVEAICEQDERAFANYLVPKAIMVLRQGVGRLIRSRRDVGVVVILDRRLIDMHYGRKMLASLPQMPSSTRLESISEFLADVELARAS